MSDVETAQTGAEVAPVVQEQTQEAAQTPTTEQAQSTDPQPRDEKGRFVPQERVNEITRARREAERGWQSERERAAQLEAELAQYRGKTQSQPTGDAPPSLEEYGYDTVKWGQAIAEHAVRQATERAESRLREQEQQRKSQDAIGQFEERARVFAAEIPDYQQRFDELAGVVRFPPEVLEALATSEQGPAIVYHLATHLDEADRLSRLPPHIAAVQLGRLEAQLSTPKPKPVSKAPDPVPTVGGGGVVTKDPERMSTDEWVAWRNAQLSK